MYKLIEQVVIEIYDEFVDYLEKNNFTYKKIKDFTPVGKWCLVEIQHEDYKALDKVEDYMDYLIRRMNYGWIVPEFTKNNF